MKRCGIVLLVVAVLVTPAWGVSEQHDDAHWRVFDAVDGLAETACESVTLGRAGNVLVRHPSTNAVSVFDGFEVTILPGPEDSRQRVYESPGGQLWTVSAGGLDEFRDGVWLHHPIAEIARQHEAGLTNDIPLVPVRHGHVLILLADQLLAFKSVPGNGADIEVIRRAEEIGLREFKRTVPARAGGLWIIGADGYARLPDSVRLLKPGEPWVVMEATHEPDELAEQSKALSNARSTFKQPVVDATVGADETVWLATSEGLVRRGPSIWEPDPVSAIDQPSDREKVSSILARLDPAGDAEVLTHSWQAGFVARNGDVWLGGERDIAWQHKGVWRGFTSTNQIGPEDVLGFVEAPDGRVHCATPSKVWEFDGRNWLALRSGFDGINALHFARNGTLWVATSSGVHRFVRGAWVHNDMSDGLASDMVTAIYEDTEGRVSAVSSRGVCVFQPDADADAPRTVIHPLAERERGIREGGVIRVSFGGRDKWDVTRPDRLLFSHRLDDHEWSPFVEPVEVVFADLSVGNHSFQVRAMDRNANIDPQPARLDLVVTLPWYREARLVLVLVVALAVAVVLAAVALNRHRRLRLSYADVERQVAERTRELEIAQRELLHSQKMNALGTLSAGIAHDFNNILSIVRGSAQIIAENTDNPQKIHTRVDRIKTVVEQGAGIVSAMLGFSGGADEQPYPCDVNRVVEDTIRLLGDRFLHEVDVRFEPASGLPEIVSVKNLIQQILLNLIFNAAEAMSGNKQITLLTGAWDTLPKGLVLKPGPASGFVCVSVRDTGCGIAPDLLPRIFEPFFTTKALSTKRGTGLGLSMVYELAKKLGGGLAVESVVGTGSTFTLILPVEKEAH